MSRSGTKNCGVCQTRWSSSDTVVITGQGTEDDPYSAEFDIDPVAGNLLEQGPNGAAAFVAPKYLDFPAVHLYSTVEQTIAFDTVQALLFNEERYNTDNMRDEDDPGIIQINTAGVYLVTFNIRWSRHKDSTATGDLACFLLKNGSEYIALDSMPILSDERAYAQQSLSYEGDFEAGDFISALVKQDVEVDDEGKNLSVTVERQSPIFAAILLRDPAIESCA